MHGVLWVLGIAAGASLLWWASLWWPLKRCPRCHGEGRTFSPGRGSMRVCTRCNGAKEVRRFGAGKAE